MPRRTVEPGDLRFTRGLARLAARRANEPTIVQGMTDPTIELVPAIGAPRKDSGVLVPGQRAPDTMIVGLEDAEDDWIDTDALWNILVGDPPAQHQTLYQFVKPGVLETYYVGPHLKRMYAVLDWDKLRAADLLRRVKGAHRGKG